MLTRCRTSVFSMLSALSLCALLQSGCTHHTGIACPAEEPLPVNELIGKQWELVSLNGKPAEVFPGQPAPHIIFRQDEQGNVRISGADGCNRLIGICERTEAGIHFSHMGSTMMLCPYGDQQARAFVHALAETTQWRFADTAGTQLELLRGGAVLLVLKAAE